MRHVLALSTLYPNAAAPRFGTFVARSMESIARRHRYLAPGAEEWRVTVVNPIGLPPIAFGKYRSVDGLPHREEWNGLTVHRPRFRLIPRFGARLNAAAIARMAVPLIRQIHKETPIDLIDAQFFFPDGPAAAQIAGELRLPLTIKARGSDITHWGEQGFARAQMLEAAAKADGILAVSEALADAAARMGMEREAIKVHYTGLDRDLFRPLAHTQLRSQLGGVLGFPMPERVPVFACVGALIERKGQAIALRALAEMRRDHPEARLIFVGTGEDEPRLRALADELGLARRVHFTGTIDHNMLPLVLSASNAMVLPTANEGLANAWVEALACGTPVITCDVGGVRELIRDRVAGRIVARDPAAIAQGLREVLADQPDPLAVAESVLAFDWRSHADRLAAHYASLLAR
ncbi:MAG: glycosyltransferase [Erythrobacter sp.]|jgi:glycosyltransferase involved in cell wall biosynthesis|nr:glycosyltransferase [Erythrobacter sp.]